MGVDTKWLFERLYGLGALVDRVLDEGRRPSPRQRMVNMTSLEEYSMSCAGSEASAPDLDEDVIDDSLLETMIERISEVIQNKIQDLIRESKDNATAVTKKVLQVEARLEKSIKENDQLCEEQNRLLNRIRTLEREAAQIDDIKRDQKHKENDFKLLVADKNEADHKLSLLQTRCLMLTRQIVDDGAATQQVNHLTSQLKEKEMELMQKTMALSRMEFPTAQGEASSSGNSTERYRKGHASRIKRVFDTPQYKEFGDQSNHFLHGWPSELFSQEGSDDRNLSNYGVSLESFRSRKSQQSSENISEDELPIFTEKTSSDENLSSESVSFDLTKAKDGTIIPEVPQMFSSTAHLSIEDLTGPSLRIVPQVTLIEWEHMNIQREDLMVKLRDTNVTLKDMKEREVALKKSLADTARTEWKLENDIAALQTRLKEKETEVGALNTTNGNLQLKVAETIDKLRTADKELKELREQNLKLLGALGEEKVEVNLIEAHENLMKLEKKVFDLNLEVTEQKVELVALNEDLVVVNEDLVVVNEELVVLNEELVVVNEDMVHTKTTLLNVNEELNTTGEELVAVTTQLGKTTRELGSAQAELQQANEELQHAHVELDTLKQKMNFRPPLSVQDCLNTIVLNEEPPLVEEQLLQLQCVQTGKIQIQPVPTRRRTLTTKLLATLYLMCEKVPPPLPVLAVAAKTAVDIGATVPAAPDVEPVALEKVAGDLVEFLPFTVISARHKKLEFWEELLKRSATACVDVPPLMTGVSVEELEEAVIELHEDVITLEGVVLSTQEDAKDLAEVIKGFMFEATMTLAQKEEEVTYRGEQIATLHKKLEISKEYKMENIDLQRQISLLKHARANDFKQQQFDLLDFDKRKADTEVYKRRKGKLRADASSDVSVGSTSSCSPRDPNQLPDPIDPYDEGVVALSLPGVKSTLHLVQFSAQVHIVQPAQTFLIDRRGKSVLHIAAQDITTPIVHIEGRTGIQMDSCQ
eukprot:Lankesteria_metandrocarpae@DN563_c0_g1_i1.p1